MLIVRTDKPNYNREETVLMTLTWTNDSPVAQEVTFPSAQRYDVIVERDGQAVWQWSAGKFFAQVLTTLVIQPGDSRVFKVEWSLNSLPADLLPPGEYAVRAWILGTHEQGGTHLVIV
jgi:hypothetical protein